MIGLLRRALCLISTLSLDLQKTMADSSNEISIALALNRASYAFGPVMESAMSSTREHSLKS